MINRISEWMRRFGPRFGWILIVRSLYTATRSSDGVIRTLGIAGAVLVVSLLLFDLWEQHHPRPKRRKSREREAEEQGGV
jgi:hypothetical protein